MRWRNGRIAAVGAWILVWVSTLGAEMRWIDNHSLTIDRVEAGVWLAQGELGMHGRFLPLNVRAVRQGDRFTGTATVIPTDFGTPPVRIAGTSALGANEVRVDFDVVLEAP